MNAYSKNYAFIDLLALAESKNVSKKIFETEAFKVDAEIGRIKSSQLPNLSITVGGEKINTFSNEELDENYLTAEFVVNYNLLGVYKNKNAIDSKKQYRKRFDLLANYSTRALFRQLKKEYVVALANQKLLKLTRRELLENEKIKKRVMTKFSQGLVGKADVLDVEMRKATLEHQLLSLQEKLDHSLDDIRKTTYLPHSQKIVLKDVISHHHIKYNLREFQKSSIEKNIDLKLQSSKLEELNYRLQQSKRAYLPDVNLRANYGKVKYIDRLNNDSIQGVIGVYLEMPIYDGGKRNADKRIVNSEILSSKIKNTNTKKNLEIEVVHKFEKMENIHKQVDLAEKNLQRAKVFYSSVFNEYKRGVKNSLDLISARDRVQSFEIDIINSTKEFEIAKLELEEISGLILE